MNKIYIYKEKRYQRDYKILIENHKDTMFNIASFATEEQLEFFKNTLGFKTRLLKILHAGTDKEIKILLSNYTILSDYFLRLEDIPKRAKPIKALSNGSIVTCYYCKNYKQKTITIYRPNPNCKSIYIPLSTEEHIAHQKIYGTY